MSLSFERAAEATGAEVRAAEHAPQFLKVATDTRSLEPGDTFLALRGERFDGHDFIDEALRKGASALILETPKAQTDGVTTLLVRDTRRAYMDLAAAARAQFAGRVVAVTGSSGKTTTKHLLFQLLCAGLGESAVAATPANENNEIGVSKFLLSVPAAQQVAIVELGARHRGEIAELVAIAAPHIGILTNIGDAHLEIFGSRRSSGFDEVGTLFAGRASGAQRAGRDFT